MKVISLFSGGGLGDYGLELAGMKIVYQVEIDEYCQRILKLRWPRVPKWRNIKTLNPYKLPECDLIAGGFPCQDISVAGKGEGIKGERSGLWKEFLRIIRAIRPNYILVENVSALRSRGLAVVLADLAEIGYDAEWHCIPASAIGAPHQRDRIWILGYPKYFRFNAPKIQEGPHEGGICNKEGKVKTSELKGSGEQYAPLANSHSPRKQQPKRNKQKQRGWIGDKGKDVSNSTVKGLSIGKQEALGEKAGHEKSKRQDSPGRTWWSVEPSVGRVAHGVARRVDRLKLLGNGQVVQAVEWIGIRIINLKKEEPHATPKKEN